MTSQEYDNLQRGDIIRHKSRGSSYVIESKHSSSSYGDYYIAVRTVHVTHPDEWFLDRKAGE